MPVDDVVDGGGEAAPVAVELERPARELEAEGGRLGVDRVGATHHQRVGFRACARDQRVEEGVDVAEQSLAGGAKLERERRVEDVAAGEAEVQVPALGPDGLGDLADERDHVVVGGLLDLRDPLHVDRRARLDRGERVRRHEPASDLGPGDGDLHPEHVLEASRLGPDRAHLGERVAPDHAAAPMSWRRCRPVHEMRAAARCAAPAAASTIRPAADDRHDAAPVRPPCPVGIAAGAGMEHQGAVPERNVDPLDRIAAPRPLRIALGSQHDPDGRRRQRRRRTGSAVLAEPAAGGGEQQRSERDREPRQDHLGLGVAEARVELEQPRVRRRSASARRRARRGTACRAAPSSRRTGRWNRSTRSATASSGRSSSGE